MLVAAIERSCHPCSNAGYIFGMNRLPGMAKTNQQGKSCKKTNPHNKNVI
jgi:hypothetical protein